MSDMSQTSQAKEERQRKALQREILRAQSNAQTRATGGSVRKRDWGSVVLLVIIFILVIIAAFLFWIIATGRMRLPTVDTMSPPVQQTGDTTPQMDNAWQDPTLQPAIKIDPNYLEETVFLGDSNTVRLWMYEYVEEDQCLAQDSIGVGAVTYLRLSAGSASAGYSNNYGRTMIESITTLQPKRVLMTFGSNDIGGYTAEEFIALYREAIEAIRAVSDCDIIVNSIFPARQRNAYPNLQSDSIIEFNAALEEMCQQEGIPFLNSYEALVGEDGWCKPEYTIDDGVHLNEVGLEVFLDYYRSHAYVADENE